MSYLINFVFNIYISVNAIKNDIFIALNKKQEDADVIALEHLKKTHDDSAEEQLLQQQQQEILPALQRQLALGIVDSSPPLNVGQREDEEQFIVHQDDNVDVDDDSAVGGTTAAAAAAQSSTREKDDVRSNTIKVGVFLYKLINIFFPNCKNMLMNKNNFVREIFLR